MYNDDYRDHHGIIKPFHMHTNVENLVKIGPSDFEIQGLEINH